jgi:hypothetical protein
MNYLKISNKGILDIEALTLLGASSKRDDDTKIGQYGSGNKFALAYLLRNNYEVTILTGGFQIFLTTKKKKFRDKEFDIILVNNKETSITTEFGKDWTLGQAIRELYCNAIDEGEHIMEFVADINNEPNKTSFYIKSREEINNYVSNFNNYFAEKKKVLFECPYGKILEKNGTNLNLYRKGVRCMETNKQSTYDYDLSDVLIDENRLVKFTWQVPSLIWNLIYQCDDEHVIKNILNNSHNTDFIECIPSDFESVDTDLMSETYKNVIKSIKLAPKSMGSLVAENEIKQTSILPDTIYRHAAKIIDKDIDSKYKISQNGFYIEIDLNNEQQDKLNQVLEFFNGHDYNIPCNITAARFEKKHDYGFADLKNNRIIISESCLNKDIETIKKSILEFYICLKHNIKNTEDLAEVIIEELLSNIQKH